jgi:PAS domain S-box-containing protein
VLVAWYAGFGPAALAAGLGLLIAEVQLVVRDPAIFAQGNHLLGIFFYTASSTVTLAIVEGHRRARERAETSEQARRAGEARLVTTLRSIGDAVIATDAGGRITFVNPVAEQLTGWSEAEARGRECAEVFRIINEQTRQAVESPVSRVISDGAIVGLANHTLLIGKDGRTIPIDDSGAPIRAEDGALSGVILVFRDVSARRRNEEAISFLAECSRVLASSLDYETTLENVARLAVPRLADWCTIDILEEDGSLRQMALAHPDPEKIAWVRSLPRRPQNMDAAHGTPRVLRTGEPEFHAEITDALLVEVARDEQELAFLRQARPCSAMTVPLKDHGRTFGALALVTAESSRHYDEADLRYAEEVAHHVATAVTNARLYHAAQEADQRKDEFLAMLAHELRNPLAPIRNSLELLRLRLPETPELRRQREVIERQVRQLGRLTDDLLDVSRLTRGRMELRREPVDLARLVRTTAEDHRGMLDDAGLTLHLDVPETPVIVNGDAARLAQAVGNLLHNAAKFTDPGGQVFVQLSSRDGEASVSVRDTGIGISAEMLPRVFDTFTQADRSLARTRGGLGIGLALVKGILERHGGRTRAESAGPDCGATFTLTLPARPAELRPPTGALPGVIAGASKRVLIIEDNADAAETMRDLLQLTGHEVEVAGSGAAGIEAAERFRPEMVLCDIGLPEMDGYEVARAIRRNPALASVRLIAITGYARDEDRQRAVEAGFDVHMAKPIDPGALRRLATGEETVVQ